MCCKKGVLINALGDGVQVVFERFVGATVQVGADGGAAADVRASDGGIVTGTQAAVTSTMLGFSLNGTPDLSLGRLAAAALEFGDQHIRYFTQGGQLLTGAVTLVILVVAWSSTEFGWLSAATGAMILAAAAMLAAFAWWEPRAKSPIVPMRLFANRIIVVILPLVAIAGGIIATVSAFMPLFLQSVTGVSPTNSGLIMAPMMGGITVSGILIGRRTAVTGRYRRYPIVGMALAVAGMATVVFIEDTGLGLAAAIDALL
jgi:hypothetical protein